MDAQPSSSTALTITQATLADLDTATQLMRRFFTEETFLTPPDQIDERMKQLLTDPASAIFLGWKGLTPVGIATVITGVSIEFGVDGELEDLYVRPDQRATGVGRALVRAVQAWCRTHGLSYLALIVTPEGQARYDLIGYYRQLGFRASGRTVLYADLHELARSPAAEAAMPRLDDAPLTFAAVAEWLDAYAHAWQTYDPLAIGALFSADAVYAFDPFTAPIVGRAAIMAAWLAERDPPETYAGHYEPLLVVGDQAVASGRSHYRAEHPTLAGGEFANLFVLRFDRAGQCSEYREWYLRRDAQH